MKIVLCHSSYQMPGGEDRVFRDELALLKSRGHDIVTFQRDNSQISPNKLRIAFETVWSARVYREIRDLMRRERPDIVHFHNTFPTISPAAYFAVRHEGIPTVQTLHNYRLLCPAASLYRKEAPCESCLGKSIAWKAVAHRCYRGSVAATAATVGMLTAHWAIGTWQSQVSQYIALTEFSKSLFVAGGLPKDRVTIKPNFVRVDAGVGPGDGGYAVYVGRLTREKGIPVLLAGWRELARDIPLKIIGQGPMETEVKEACANDSRIEWLGQQSHESVMAYIGRAAVLVFPSASYETFGRAIIEAYSTGTAVVAAGVGATPELVQDGKNGLLFPRNDAAGLIRQVRRLLADVSLRYRLRTAGREEYLTKYSADVNYERLIRIYRRLVECKPNMAPPPSFLKPPIGYDVPSSDVP